MSLTFFFFFLGGGIFVGCFLVGGFDSTHLKKISQIGSFPQVGVQIKNI